MACLDFFSLSAQQIDKVKKKGKICLSLEFSIGGHRVYIHQNKACQYHRMTHVRTAINA